MRKLDPPPAQVAKVIASLAVLGAVFFVPNSSCCASKSKDIGALGDLDAALTSTGGKDQEQCEGVTNGGAYSRWFKHYLAGNSEAADKDWAEVLKQLPNAEDMRPLFRLTNSRLAFADQPPGAPPDRLSFTVCDKTMLASTLKVRGPNSLVVLSGQWFVSSYQDKVKTDVSAGLIYKRALAAAHEKKWGPQDPRLIADYEQAAQTCDYLKHYKEAIAFEDKVIAVAQKNKLTVPLQRAKQSRANINQRMVSQSAKH